MVTRCQNFLTMSTAMLISLIFMASSIGVMSGVAYAADSAEVTCECTQDSCGPCEVETGVSFYSAKCGKGLARVKSCKKPQCLPVENQKACLARVNKKSESPAASPVPSPVESDDAQAVVHAGEVVNSSGIAQLIRASGPVVAAKPGVVTNVGDTVETKADGKVKIRLDDGSEMIVAANSRVTVQRVKVDVAAGKRNIMLELVTGKVRSRVKKHFDQENAFVVKTRTAVAGVRGTDFVASFEPGEKEWVSEVRTFEGLVRLESVKAPGADPLKPARAVDIPGGTYAAFVVGPPAHADDEEAFFKSIEDGTVSAVYKMREEEIQSLDAATEFGDSRTAAALSGAVTVAKPGAASAAKSGRSTASVEGDVLCGDPPGQFNQCSYACEGNPAGEKARCRTDLPGVACVRRLCRANGVWAEPKKLPASQWGRCQVGKPVVGACGDYW